MRLNEVINRFALVSGLEPSEVTRWTPLCVDAMNELRGKLIPDALKKEENVLRLSACAGVLAYYKYCLYKEGEGIKSFTAGAVSVTHSELDGEKARKLWEFERESVADLLESFEDFCFRSVKS